MATLNPGLGLKRYSNLLVVIKQTAFEEYSQVRIALQFWTRVACRLQVGCASPQLPFCYCIIS